MRPPVAGLTALLLPECYSKVSSGGNRWRAMGCHSPNDRFGAILFTGFTIGYVALPKRDKPFLVKGTA